MSVLAGSDYFGLILASVSDFFYQKFESILKILILLLNLVEAQKDFHLKRLAELGLLITTTTSTTTQRTTTTTVTSTTKLSTTSTTTSAPIRITFRERLQTPVPQTPPPEIVSISLGF